MITTTQANNILKLFFAQTTSISGTGKCYLGLSSTTPTADGGNFTEPDPATTGYKRAQINILEATQYTNQMGTPADGSISNVEEITFPEALVAYPAPITHFGIFGAQTGGTPLYVHALTAPEPSEDDTYAEQPVTVEQNEVLLFRQGTLSLTFAQD